MESEGRVSGFVSLMSGMSALSLIAFGGISLVLLLFSWSWSGGFISLALLGHGLYEWRLRKQILARPERATGHKLAWNQMGLAGSVILYLAWQVFTFDKSAVQAALDGELGRALLQQYPELAELLSSELPKFVAGFYSLAGALVLLGCIGMAALYTRVGVRRV